MQTEINLLKPVFAEESDAVSPMEAEAKKYIFWGFIVIVFVSTLTLIVYLVISMMQQSLISANERLTVQLNQQKAKENTFAVIKSRISVVNNVIKISKPISQIIKTAINIAPPPNLVSIAQSENDKVVLNYKISSVEDAILMTGILTSYYNQKKVSTPRMDEFQINKSGATLVFSFTPIWENP
jgi:hypothetical protein